MFWYVITLTAIPAVPCTQLTCSSCMPLLVSKILDFKQVFLYVCHVIRWNTSRFPDYAPPHKNVIYTSFFTFVSYFLTWNYHAYMMYFKGIMFRYAICCRWQLWGFPDSFLLISPFIWFAVIVKFPIQERRWIITYHLPIFGCSNGE